MPLLRSLCAALLVVLASCDDSPTAPTVRGNMTAVLDATPWRGSATVALRGDTIHLWSTRTGPTEQHIRATVAFTGPGSYTLEGKATEYQETLGGDVLTYRALGTGGTLVVTSYNVVKGEMTGTLTFSASGSRGTTNFVGGEFVAEVGLFP